jgi:hypothetical protein
MNGFHRLNPPGCQLGCQHPVHRPFVSQAVVQRMWVLQRIATETALKGR